jgi:hypothetical protein
MIFIPGGYTPARNSPVKNLSATPDARPSDESANTALTIAPHTADKASSRRVFITSDRLKTALMSVPTTKPSCTESVSHPACVSVKDHSARIAGTTAEAENHSDMANNSASARRASARQRPRLSAISSPLSLAISRLLYTRIARVRQTNVAPPAHCVRPRAF